MGRRLVSLAALLCLAALCLPAPSAHAAGMDLRWSACASDGGTSNRDFACDTDAGTQVMVASFTLDQPITGLIFVASVVDIVVADHQAVPAWWEFFDFAGCRLGALSADVTIDPAAVNCVDWAGGDGGGGLIGWDHSGTVADADTASHRRIKLAGAHDAPGADVLANQEYFAFNLTIDDAGTTDPGGCAGCSQPVCIVLNSMQFLTAAASASTMTNASAPGSNFATWQGGSGANCFAVPTRKATWGQVKALYH